MNTQPTCKERVTEHYKSRMDDIRQLWESYKDNPEAEVEDLGTFNEYGLAFDYVSPRTFTDQRRGYFRYQLSTGGPGDEFRFYVDENLNPTRIEYWFLDWWDGAKRVLRSGADFDLLAEILEDFREVGTLEYAMKQVTE